MKKAVPILITVGVLLAILISFIAGQMYEAKQRLKFDIQHARHMYRYIEAGNMPGLVGDVETILASKSRAMQSALDSPSSLYLCNLTGRRVASDKHIRDLIGEIENMKPAFTNMMITGEKPEQGN